MSLTVTDRDGRRGTVETQSLRLDMREPQVQVQMEDGQTVTIPTEILERQEDGNYHVPFSLMGLEQRRGTGVPSPEDTVVMAIPKNEASGAEEVIVPVIVEEMDVRKQAIVTGRIRLTKTVQEREEVWDEPLTQETVNVERVPVNRMVEGPIPVRYEGDVTILPVLEEVLVVEKRLMLKEEIRITRLRTEVRQPQTVTLRREKVTVERLGADDATVAPATQLRTDVTRTAVPGVQTPGS